MTSPSPDPLESFWEEAEQNLLAKRRMKNASPEKPKKVTSDTFTLPENWTQTRAIALIHAETQTLIGNFLEYKHVRVPHARKLIRCDSPVAVSATEMVSGPQWVHLERIIPSPQSATATRDIVMTPLPLYELGVQAEIAEMKIYFQWGGIIRAELRSHTTFHSPDNRTILTLGAGTNLLEVMDLNAKLQMREELR